VTQESKSSKLSSEQNRQSLNGLGPALSTPRLVQTPAEFAQMMAHLRLQPLVAMDTESDSFYRYTPRVCLIQLSAPINPSSSHPSENHVEDDTLEIVDYLVDPLRLTDLQALGELLADPGVEVIVHAAENDILLLQRDFNFTINNIFDTQLAARILGRKGVGLAAILQEEFGVTSDKSMQRTDWGRRPLTPQQMTYAQIDTHYLPVLRRRQIAQLQEAGRWREAQEAFRMLELIQYEEPQEARKVWSMKGTRDVEADQLGLLEELWLWREETARRQERPPFRVFNDRVLIELVQRVPLSLSELRQVPGLDRNQVERYGEELLNALHRGQTRPRPPLPAPTPRPEFLLSKQDQKLFHALRQWRSDMASERSVDPDIVFSNDILLQIVETKPASVDELQAVPLIGSWKAENYGPAILRLIERHR
jgi:ribonuclease D